MFLLRSAFWLTLMFLLIAPKEFDLGKVASDASRQAIDAGRQVVVNQALAVECASVQCAGSQAAIAILAGDAPTSAEGLKPAAIVTIPMPRPRPDRLG